MILEMNNLSPKIHHKDGVVLEMNFKIPWDTLYTIMLSDMTTDYSYRKKRI